MFRILLLITLAVTVSESSFAQVDAARLQKCSEIEPLRYLLYSPEQHESSAITWPLVLFLHGGGEGGDDIEEVKKHGLPKLIASGKPFPFFVVSPQNPSESQFWDDQQLIRLLDQLEDELPVDRSRVYLTGLSRGAYGAWRLAIQNPERFAALVPISGGGPLPYVKRITTLPIWVFHGEKDPVIPLVESERLVNELRRLGGNVRFTVYPEAGHDAWTETYDDPRLYQWLLRQKKAASQSR
jgi:predicted peptidase